MGDEWVVARLVGAIVLAVMLEDVWVIEVMEEPHMALHIRVKVAVTFKILKKKLPFVSNSGGKVSPQSFDTNIVYTPKYTLVQI